MARSNKIVVLDRALQILDQLAERGGPVGVTELSQALNIPKASVYRILSTLDSRQIVIQDPQTELYTLGPAILRLSHEVELQPALLALVQPFLEILASQTGELANIGVAQDGKVFVVSSVSRSGSRLMIDPGPVAEFHCSSLGKALLIDKSPKEVRALLGSGKLPVHTPNTLKTVDELLHQLEAARHAGFAMDDEETEEGLICYGAPIRDWAGRVVAAISVSAPKARVDGSKAELIKRRVLEAALKVSKNLTGPET